LNVWTVVPLSRPGQLPWVIENWARQTTKSSLAIVETGAAVGVCHQAGITPDLLLSAAGRPGEVRNAALEALVGAYVAFQDDDDWYGPDYLAEHVELAARGRIVGKRVHWVDFLGDELLLFRPQAAGTRGGWVLAGTMGGYAEDFPRFSAVETGEEIAVAEIGTPDQTGPKDQKCRIGRKRPTGPTPLIGQTGQRSRNPAPLRCPTSSPSEIAEPTMNR